MKGVRYWEYELELNAEVVYKDGVPLDHSFLSCKKQLTAYGYAVGRISMKNRIVPFIRQEKAPLQNASGSGMAGRR